MNEEFEDVQDMAQTNLELLCKDLCSPELLTLYRQILQRLDESGFSGHQDELDLLVAKYNDHEIDVLTVVPSVDECIRTACERCFNLIGVRWNEEIDLPVEMLAEAMDILLGFEPTDTPEIIRNAMDAADDSASAIVRLLELQGTFTEEDWFPYLTSVHEGVIKRIKKLTGDAMEANEANPIPTASGELLKRLARLVKMKGDSLGAEIGQENLGIGMSLESLYVVHIAQVIDKPQEKAIDELYSLAALSGVSFEQAEIEVSRCMDDLYYEIPERRKAEQIRLTIGESYRPIFGGSDE